MKPRVAGGLLRASRLSKAPAVALGPAEDLPPELLQPPVTLLRPVATATMRPPPSLEEQKEKRPAGRGSSWWSSISAWGSLRAPLQTILGILLRPRSQSHVRAARRRRLRLPPNLLLAWLAVALLEHARNLWTGQVGFNHYPSHPVVWPHREPARRADLRSLAVQNTSADSCAQALQSPKVALLFLTLGRLPFELTWRKWFRSAEGMLPIGPVAQSGLCNGKNGSPESSAVRRLQAACDPPKATQQGSAASILLRQHLFSVYVHVPPDFPVFPADSLFGGRGTVIAVRVPTRWGTHTLVEAMRELLWVAASDPANQRFVLLSESDLPLYDPLTFYKQLMSEAKSRVNACAYPAAEAYVKSSMWRWTPPMQFNLSYWRKSSQWFTLIRSHAEAVLEDVDIFRAFEEHCWSGFVPEYWRKRDCFSDEHYLPTLLAVRGLEKECACEAWSGPAYVDWWGMKAHPRTFKAKEVNASLIMKARGERPWQNCKAGAAQRDAAGMFVHLEDLAGPKRAQLCSRLRREPLPTYAHPLEPTCAVTARKFDNSRATVRAAHVLYRGCEGAKLGLLGGQYRRKARGCGLS